MSTSSSSQEGSLQIDAETCVICLESMQDNGRVQTLLCEHRFHAECLQHWEHNSNLCPTCRCPIKHTLLALKEALNALSQAANEVSIACMKLKTVTKQNVGHLPMAQDAARNLDDMSANIGQVVHLLSGPDMDGDINANVLRQLLRSEPTVMISRSTSRSRPSDPLSSLMQQLMNTL